MLEQRCMLTLGELPQQLHGRLLALHLPRVYVGVDVQSQPPTPPHLCQRHHRLGDQYCGERLTLL